MKRRRFTSKAESKKPWEPTLTRPFTNGSTNAASWLARKILCIILPNRRKAAPGVLWCFLTRRLSHRHTCLVVSSIFCMRGKFSLISLESSEISNWWLEIPFRMLAPRPLFFRTDHKASLCNRLSYWSFIINNYSVVSIDSSGYQNENFPSCMRYVGARFIQVYGRKLPMLSHGYRMQVSFNFPRFHKLR